MRWREFASTLGSNMTMSKLSVSGDELKACREHWEQTKPAVAFPDYWAGWQAASTSSIAVANLAGQLNAALQPAYNANSFREMRISREQLRDAVKNMLEHIDQEWPYGSPQHCHSVAAKWDKDGSTCQECAAFDKLRELVL